MGSFYLYLDGFLILPNCFDALSFIIYRKKGKTCKSHANIIHLAVKGKLLWLFREITKLKNQF